jgi:hypothetical protein
LGAAGAGKEKNGTRPEYPVGRSMWGPDDDVAFTVPVNVSQVAYGIAEPIPGRISIDLKKKGAVRSRIDVNRPGLRKPIWAGQIAAHDEIGHPVAICVSASPYSISKPLLNGAVFLVK